MVTDTENNKNNSKNEKKRVVVEEGGGMSSNITVSLDPLPPDMSTNHEYANEGYQGLVFERG